MEDMSGHEITNSPQLRLIGIAARQWGLVTADQVVGCGLHRDTARRWAREGKIDRLRTGIYRLPGFPDSYEQGVMAAVLAGRPSAVASHATAARLHGLDGFDRTAEIHLLSPRGGRVTGTQRHQTTSLARIDRQVINRIPATTPTRTLIDVAGTVSRARLEQALESALRKRITSLALCRQRIRVLCRPNTRGPVALRALLQMRGDVPATGSLAETEFLQLVRAGGLPEPERQYPVGHRLLDFAWPLVRVGAEIDGAETHTGQSALDRDLVRQNAIVLEGWLILRYTAVRVRDPQAHHTILEELRRAHQLAA